MSANVVKPETEPNHPSYTQDELTTVTKELVSLQSRIAGTAGRLGRALDVLCGETSSTTEPDEDVAAPQSILEGLHQQVVILDTRVKRLEEQVERL